MERAEKQMHSGTLKRKGIFMELDNTISTPLYKQLEEMLREEINTGKQPQGSRFPTENELSETYQVSRVTCLLYTSRCV